MNEELILERLWEMWDTEPPDTPLGNAIFRLKNPATLRYGDGPWLLEGFVSFFTAIRDAAAAIRGTEPQPLAAHCFDVNSLAYLFSLDPKDFAQSRSVVTRRPARGRPKTTDEIAAFCFVASARPDLEGGRSRVPQEVWACRSQRAGGQGYGEATPATTWIAWRKARFSPQECDPTKGVLDSIVRLVNVQFKSTKESEARTMNDAYTEQMEQWIAEGDCQEITVMLDDDFLDWYFEDSEECEDTDKEYKDAKTAIKKAADELYPGCMVVWLPESVMGEYAASHPYCIKAPRKVYRAVCDFNDFGEDDEA